jgi:uncharacterized membrane protein
MNKLNRPRTSLFKRVSKTFIAGLLAALPLVLTLAAIVWLVDFIQRFLGPKSEFGKLWKSIGLQFISSETAAYIIGVLVTLILIFMLGLVVQTGLKYRWQAMVDGIMEGLPLVRTIYNALNKLTRMFEQREEADMKAMRAVMCHFGGKGGTAVLALMPSPEVVHLNGHDYNAVLIPTAPVPFGGAILYVPVEWVEPADMEFDGLFNIYMSMGATSTDYLHRQAAQGSREESQ